MNKWMILAAASILCMATAHADQTFGCRYKDYFRVSNASHPEIFIVSSYADDEMFLQIIGPRRFLLRGMPRCDAGYAHVTVAYDATHWCVLDIKDGPWMYDPTVSASCNGMNYLGTTYDGVGSLSYTISLD